MTLLVWRMRGERVQSRSTHMQLFLDMESLGVCLYRVLYATCSWREAAVRLVRNSKTPCCRVADYATTPADALQLQMRLCYMYKEALNACAARSADQRDPLQVHRVVVRHHSLLARKDRSLRTKLAVFLHHLSSCGRLGMAGGRLAQGARRSLLVVGLIPRMMCFAPGWWICLNPKAAA